MKAASGVVGTGRAFRELSRPSIYIRSDRALMTDPTVPGPLCRIHRLARGKLGEAQWISPRYAVPLRDW